MNTLPFSPLNRLVARGHPRRLGLYFQHHRVYSGRSRWRYRRQLSMQTEQVGLIITFTPRSSPRLAFGVHAADNKIDAANW